MSAVAEQVALVVNVKGEILKSNFDDFKESATQFIEGINYNLKTDDDFGQASLDVKQLGDFEKALAEGEDSILRELDDVYKIIEGCRELKSLSSEKRLHLSREMKAKRDEVIAGIVLDGIGAITFAGDHFRPILQAAVKGKRKLESMKDAVASEVEGINANIVKCRTIIDGYKEVHGESIAYNESKLLVGDPKDTERELEIRLERKRSEEEKAKLKAEADKLKAQAEAAKKADDTEMPAAKVEPEPLPQPKKVDSISVGGSVASEPDASREWEEFKQTCIGSFAPVKAARLSLRNDANIKRAQVFADALAAAWKEVTK
jgi:hypothetical protein